MWNEKQPAQNRHYIFDRTSWPQIQMQKLSSRSNSIWSRNNRIELFTIYSRQDIWIWWSNILQNINEPELCFGQLDQSTEQTICSIHTNIIMRQTNPLCTEALRESSKPKKPRNYVARATIHLSVVFWSIKSNYIFNLWIVAKCFSVFCVYVMPHIINILSVIFGWILLRISSE